MPSGAAGSNPALPTLCRSPSTGGGAVWKKVGRGKPGLQVQVLSAALSIWRRVLIGRQPVPNTGDPKGFESSNLSVFAYKPLWQNWQMHLPAKQGPVDPASGVGTRERRSARKETDFSDFSKKPQKSCNKPSYLYYEYNDKAFKRCYSGCQKK